MSIPCSLPPRPHQYRQRAKFLVGLDYNLLPFDKHKLNFTLRFPAHDTASKACFAIGERNATAVELPDLQLGNGWKQGDAPAVWSGEPDQARREGLRHREGGRGEGKRG